MKRVKEFAAVAVVAVVAETGASLGFFVGWGGVVLLLLLPLPHCYLSYVFSCWFYVF